MTVWRMQYACWIPKATHSLRICNTYCFSTRTKSHERAAMLRRTCSACLVLYDSCAEFYVNGINGLVADSHRWTEGGTLDKRRPLLFVSYIQVVRRMLSC